VSSDKGEKEEISEKEHIQREARDAEWGCLAYCYPQESGKEVPGLLCQWPEAVRTRGSLVPA